jgi:hypothetical protein
MKSSWHSLIPFLTFLPNHFNCHLQNSIQFPRLLFSTLCTPSSQSQSYFTTGCLSPSVRHGVKLLETNDKRFFPLTEPLLYSSLCNTFSNEKMDLSLMNMLGLSASARIALWHVTEKMLLLHYTQFLCQYRLCRAYHAYLPYLMLQRQLNHLNGRKLDHLRV